MADQKARRGLSTKTKRTIRKTSAAVLMTAAIAVAAIPARNIEAVANRETNTGLVVANDNRGTYQYLYLVDKDDSGNPIKIGEDDQGNPIYANAAEKDDRKDSRSASTSDYKDSASVEGTYYKKLNDSSLAAYHRLEKAAELSGDPDDGPQEGTDFLRSYSVRQNSQGYYLNWQFAYNENHVLCKYNDNFAEKVVELPYQVSTKYYQVSQLTFDNFYSDAAVDESGNAILTDPSDPTSYVKGFGAEELKYTFAQWNQEFDKNNPQRGDALIMREYFPDDLTSYIKYCQEYLDRVNKELQGYENELAEINRRLTAGVDDDDLRTTLNNRKAELQQLLIDKQLDARTDLPPDLLLKPSDLSLQDKCRYFCAYFDPREPYTAKADKKLKRLSAYAKGSDFTIEYARDESTGKAVATYLAKYHGNENLALGAITDNLGFLVTEFSDSPINSIGDYAFYNVKSIDTLVLPNEIQYVGDYAFATSFMKSVSMPNVRIIGNAAFKGCGQLTTMTLDTALLSKIGTEAFYGTALTALELPYSIEEICPGAFARCTAMKKIDLSAITTDCTIEEAAFYDAMSLTDLLFPPATSKSISQMGNASFAVELNNAPLAVELPANMSKLPEYLFAGRSNLQSVLMPVALGYNSSARSWVPATTFVGCSNLQYVRFPEEAKYVRYDDARDVGKSTYEDEDGVEQDVFTLFLDIDNTNFYVQGPAYSTGTEEAYERVDTWSCITNVNNFVPYIYELNGVMYYEVSDGRYILTADEMGELLSCRAVSRTGTSPIDLVIPKKVGNYTIKSIVDGCFNDANLRSRLRSITVEDDTLKEIQADVFKDLPKLKWVDLGNSVETIGSRAFAGCEALVDVTFRADQVTLGDNAFATGGDELTFHGKIAADFGPFTWAMQKDNLVKGNGVRVCYKSLSPTNMTVMYDDGTNLVTLVDYPKYRDLDRLHCDESIKYWYSLYSSSQYDNLREDFYSAWYAAIQGGGTDALKNTVYGMDNVYGPWVTPKFCEVVEERLSKGQPPQTVVTLNPGSGGGAGDPGSGSPGGSGGASGKNHAVTDLFDRVFPAVVAHAAGEKPKDYFSHPDHQYSIINKGESTGKVWDEYTADENAWIDACLNIVIPSGVQSIDTNGYFTNAKSNGTNITTYFSGANGLTDATMRMYKEEGTDRIDGKDIVPGAFSGKYVDYDDADEAQKYEKGERGNDRVLSITLTDVEYLPKKAFDSCERLERVILGPVLSDIGELPFYGCTNLKEVIGNDYYIADNGLILTAMEPGDGTYTLVECLPGRGNVVGSATVPDDTNATEKAAVTNVSQIANGAFEGCKDLRIVNLFDTNIRTIPERCFAECPALDTVFLPYSTNSIRDKAFAEDDTVTVSIPSKEVFIASDAFVHGEKAKRDPQHGKVKFNTYPDSAAAEYARYYDIALLDMATMHTVWFNDYNGVPLIDKAFYVHDGDVISGEERPADPTRNGYEFDKWISNTGIPVDGRIYEDTIFTATYIAVEGSHDGKFFVMFFDGVDGSQIGEKHEVDSGAEVTPPTPPEHNKYKFLKWSSEDYKKVEKDLVITALYSPTSSSGSSSGGSKPSGGSGSGSSSGNGDSSDDKKDGTEKKYNVTVKNGTGSGSYESGATVAIVANTPEAGKAFSKWTTEDKEVSFVNAAMSATTFKMPEKDVTVTAEFVDSAATPTAVAAPTTSSTYFPPGYGNNDGTGNKPADNNAQVIVSKPGISNIDLATAKVNGSSDSFVIKVTETNEAEEKVRGALTNRYGSIDNRIRYWACDISLYDSTGNTKIEDTTGLTIDITLPIPDELRPYGGNALVGAVADNVLESLTPKFNEINGVPCVTFTATHFSPYTIYVDTENLSASQMMDATPKTGDPIHPKWFLSIGLAAVSILLFLKKDKKSGQALKTA